MDAFPWHEASSINSADVEHVSGYFSVLHSLITSDPVVHTQMTRVLKYFSVVKYIELKSAGIFTLFCTIIMAIFLCTIKILITKHWLRATKNSQHIFFCSFGFRAVKKHLGAVCYNGRENPASDTFPVKVAVCIYLYINVT